ncbi:MAG: hypothetical protein DRR19_16190 [Candidatus Parabeggiatoa sp. nov. 1]|nr:MAG: hypothetical protein DRR19_16190 [Gammaproteobacteria bacterium]
MFFSLLMVGALVQIKLVIVPTQARSSLYSLKPLRCEINIARGNAPGTNKTLIFLFSDNSIKYKNQVQYSSLFDLTFWTK